MKYIISMIFLSTLGACATPSMMGGYTGPTPEQISFEAAQRRADAENAEPENLVADDFKARPLSQQQWNMFAARLMLAYKKADMNEFNLWCKGYPVDCSDPVKAEEHIKDSHEEAIAKEAADRHQKQVEQEFRQNQAKSLARRKAIAGAFQSFGQSMQASGRGTHCTSTVGIDGNTVYTNCN